MSTRDAMSASLSVVYFLQKYTEALAKQIEAVQQQMDSSVTNVMSALQELSTSTEDKKREAERVLEETYLAPSASTAAMVTSMQQSTDDIFEQAMQSLATSPNADPQLQPTNSVDKGADIRRMGGLFSKHMESMSLIDDSVKEIVLGMVGAMSNNDVINQRLDHSMVSLRALHLGLANILVDLDGRLKTDVIREFKENLLEYTFKSFTTESERNAFKAIFGPPPSILKAYDQSTKKAV